MKDLSYLQVFSPKTLKEAKQILNKQFTAGDINKFLGKQVQFTAGDINKFLGKQVQFTAGDINKFLGKQIQIKHMRRMPKEKRKKYLANSHWGKRKP